MRARRNNSFAGQVSPHFHQFLNAKNFGVLYYENGMKMIRSIFSPPLRYLGKGLIYGKVTILEAFSGSYSLLS